MAKKANLPNKSTTDIISVKSLNMQISKQNFYFLRITLLCVTRLENHV